MWLICLNQCFTYRQQWFSHILTKIKYLAQGDTTDVEPTNPALLQLSGVARSIVVLFIFF